MQTQKRHVITISGRLGAGKSTTSKMLAESLGYTRNYAGGLMRQMAEEAGMNFEQYHAAMKQDPNFDRLVDARQKEFINANDNIIAEGHLAWLFADNAFKVYLTLDPKVAARRIFNDLKMNPQRKVEAHNQTEEAVYKSIIERLAANRSRWQEMYNIDILDQSNFDLVIDTSQGDPNVIVKTIIDAYQAWLKK